MLKKLYQLFFKPVVETVFPPVCFLCDDFLTENRKVVCLKCWSELRRLDNNDLKKFSTNLKPKYFDKIYILYDFSEHFQKLIHLLKYNRCLTLSNYFAEELKLSHSESFFTGYDLIIPVPLHPIKLRERGYNQSYEIIKHLTGKVNNSALKRTKNTTSQTKLSRSERIKNVSQAFQCKHSLREEKVLLFDDIITTGSTLNACAVELKRCGCSVVDVMTLATPISHANIQI